MTENVEVKTANTVWSQSSPYPINNMSTMTSLILTSYLNIPVSAWHFQDNTYSYSTLMTADVGNILLQALTLCTNVQSSNRILKTGVNTLQRTLVLKTQVQLDDINRQLNQKRLEFKDRMQALEQRRAALLKKQEEVSWIKERCQGDSAFVIR